MSDATVVSDLTVSEDDAEIMKLLHMSEDVLKDVSRDVSKDLINVSKDMTKERLKFPSQEQQQQQNMTDDIMSDSDMSTDTSDDSDIENDIVTDDSMTDDEDEDDTVCEIMTFDANVVEDANCVNEHIESVLNDQEVHYEDSTTFYILNLTANPDKLDQDIVCDDMNLICDGTTDKQIVNEKANHESNDMACTADGNEKTFRSRLAQIKAFFSKKEKIENQISTESDSGITQDVSDYLDEEVASNDVSSNTKIMTDDSDVSCVADDVNLLWDEDSGQESDIPNRPDSSSGFLSFKDEDIGLMDEVGLVAELQDTINTLHSEYLAWRKSRQNSIKEINAMADSLDGHQRNVDIAKVTGTSVGAAATVAGIVFTSLALAPVTAGSSLFIGLGIGAGVVGGAGVGTGIGAVVTKKKLERGKWVRLQQIVTEDQEVTDKLRMIIERYDHVLMSVTNLVKEKEELGTARTILSAVRGTHTLAEKITVSVLKDVIRSAAGVTTEAVEGGAKAALVAGRVLGGIGIALGGIALVIDIIYLVQVGRNIRSGSKCDVAKRLRSVSKILEDEMEKIDDVLAFDLAMTGSRSRADISRSAIYDIHDLGEDDLEFDEMTFGKLHIDTSVINWSDDEMLD